MAEKDTVKTLRAALTDKLHIDLRKNPIDIKMEGDAVVTEGTVERVAIKKRALFIAMGLEGTSGVDQQANRRPSLRGIERGTHARPRPYNCSGNRRCC
jgi:hypothetical protein